MVLVKGVPLTTMTSSSFLIGIERTVYFFLRSLESGQLINFLLRWDGVVQWALRFFLLELVTANERGEVGRAVSVTT